MGPIAGLAVEGFTAAILRRLKANPRVSDDDAPELAVEAAKAAAPIIAHATNNEPWYQSRVTIGALVSIATGVLALFGIVISPEDAATYTAMILAAGPVLGGLFTLYGRWKAKKPIGS